MLSSYRLISANSYVIEPPDTYLNRFEPRFLERAPRMERRKTPTGREYDAWMLGGMQVGTLGAVMQAGQRFEDPSQIDFLGVWEDVRKGGYDAHAMIRANEEDGVWGSCLQPSQGLFWYRIPDSELLTEICRVYNDWIADFCKPYPERLKGIGMLNIDDVNEGCLELERCKKLGLVGAFIPVSPLPDKPYSHPIYDRLWWTAQEIGMPLLLHIATPRNGVPGNEFTMNVAEMTGAGRSTTDYWVRYSLSAMLFAGVFDRYPRLKVGSVEHETAWIPHWLQQMDFTYRERPVFTKGWKSREGLLPSDYWRRNMFAEFMEDELGVQMRDKIGVETMLWGSGFPHAESTWPRSQDFLGRIFAGVPEEDQRKITSDNAAKLFGFETKELRPKELVPLPEHINLERRRQMASETETEIRPDDRLDANEQARHLNAWLHEVHPMVGRPFKVSVNIGSANQSAAISAAFMEPAWEGATRLSLIISLFALDCEIDPDWQELELPRKGPTEIVSFNVTPRKPGKLQFTIRVYLARRLILLQSSTFSVDVGVEELLGAGA